MATAPAAGRPGPQPPDPPRKGDVLDLGAVRLPPPLVIALLPWWMSFGPAALCILTGRYLLAALLTGSGLLLSAAAAGVFLAISARGAPDA